MRPVEVEPVVNLFVIAHGLFSAFNLIPDSIKKVRVDHSPVPLACCFPRAARGPDRGRENRFTAAGPVLFFNENCIISGSLVLRQRREPGLC